MTRLDVGRAIHGYQPPAEKVVFQMATPLGTAKIIHNHWHAGPGEYKAFVNGRAIEPGSVYAFEDAKQALRRYLELKKTERLSFLRKRLRIEQESIRALKLFEPAEVRRNDCLDGLQFLAGIGPNVDLRGRQAVAQPQ